MQTVDYIQTRAFDHFPFYPRVAVTALGLVQILMGLLSMALGVGAICTISSGYYIAYGIWCGFMFTLTGGISIGSGIRKSSCMVFATMSLSIICCCLAVIQLSLGIVAADNDAPTKRSGVLSYQENMEEYDIYREKNNPFYYYCSGPNYRFSWANAWGPVDVLLLLAGFIQLAAALAVAIMGCHAACCGKRVPAVTYYPSYTTNTVGTGFTNEAYMTESRLSPAPPLYKLSA